MDIGGLGDSTTRQLIELGFLTDAGDIYSLNAEKLSKLAGFKDKSIRNLLSSIESSKERPIDRLLFGLSIRHLGDVAAVRLADHFGSVDAIQAASVESLLEVGGLGSVIAESVHKAMRAPLVARILEKLRAAGVRMIEQRTTRTGHLSGRTFVITGTLQSMSREAATARIVELGGTVTNSVSKKTAGLIVGGEPGTKLEKAKRAGVPLLDEQALLALLSPPET